jgi:hypothetical protein
MKQFFFKIVDKNLKIKSIESIRNGFNQFAGILLVVFFTTNSIEIITRLFKKLSVVEMLFVWEAPIFSIIFLILPLIILFFARRFPPAPEVIFHSDNQTTTWKSGNNQLQLTFPTIHFATSRLLSKSGISTVMVTIFAVDDKPFFEGEKPSQNPDMRYRKDLCVYKAGTQAEADESIEIIKSFMAGTYDDSPSKFDDI